MAAKKKRSNTVPVAALEPKQTLSPEVPDASARGARVRVVAIGASAGGLEALTEFFQAMRPTVAWLLWSCRISTRSTRAL